MHHSAWRRDQAAARYPRVNQAATPVLTSWQRRIATSRRFVSITGVQYFVRCS